MPEPAWGLVRAATCVPVADPLKSFTVGKVAVLGAPRLSSILVRV